jgi:DNA (cytosine-5)-methyltransferase 1
MRHGSLFNGIGGFQLAAHWMGWENVWHCEIDPFCNKVVKQHFPQSICYEDIKQFDAKQWRGSIDIISGGFPCQPFSQAGKRKGTADNRYLWPEMLRVIREVQPRFVVGENVGGLVNWDRGMVFEQVQADLEAAGYESAAFILPAASIGAPHKRDRIWFIAHACSDVYQGGLVNGGYTQETERSEGESEQQSRRSENGKRIWIESDSCCQDAANTYTQRLSKRIQSGERKTGGKNESYPGGESSRAFATPGNWSEFPTQSAICRRDDAISNRVDRIKALGNAIVPGVAFEIFKAIEKTQTI